MSRSWPLLRLFSVFLQKITILQKLNDKNMHLSSGTGRLEPTTTET